MIIILLLILFKTCSNDESETGDALTVSSAETVTAITDSGSEEIPASEKSDEEELSAVSEMATSNEEDEIRESLSIAGIAVNIDSKDGSTVISYPEGISDEEVEAFLDDELEKYALVGIVSYEITEDGVVITYPEDVDEEARAEAIAILTEDLASYVNEEEVVAEESASVEEKAAEEIYPLIAVITAKDISSNVESYADHTTFTIPSSVSEDDAAAFFDYEIERYGYEDTVTYEMEDGVLVLSYPAPQKEELREEAIRQIGIDLNYYLMSEEEKESADEEEIVNNITNNIIIVSRAEDAAAEAEEEEWKDIRHTFSLAVSPYALSYYDFFRARDVIFQEFEPVEFMSMYGLAASFSYDWRIIKNLSIGIEAGWYGYFLQRSTLTPGALYYQIPLLANVLFHTGGDVDFFAGLNFGVDLASLESTRGAYMKAGFELGLSWRFAEHWSLFWRFAGELTPQIHPENEMMDSITFTTQPVFLGVSYHI